MSVMMNRLAKPARAIRGRRRRATAWALASAVLCWSAAPAAVAKGGPDATRPATRPDDPDLPATTEPADDDAPDIDLTPDKPDELPADPPVAPPAAVDVPPPAPERFLAGEVPRESWEGVARRLAASLVDPAARDDEEPLFLPGAEVWRFGRSVAAGPVVLRGRFDSQVIVSVRAGTNPLANPAATLAADLRSLAERDAAANVPPSLVRRLTPRGAAEATMTRWLAASVGGESGASVAWIALWDAAATDRPDAERLTFLLLRAGRLPDGRFRLQTIRFGTAAEAVAEGF